MAFTKYENKRISTERLAVIEQANMICRQYEAQGMVLTLRQLYYQFVARDLIPNEQREYDRLGDICRDGRMAGLMDWDHLIDRTRNLMSWKSYRGPQEAVEELAKKYQRDLWAPQKKRVEVWIEKDAAIGVVEGVCGTNRVPYFSCRGYTSMSEMHAAAQRIRWHIEQGEQVTVLHIGDHDPSGLDMSRDIEDRLAQFINVDWAGLHMGGGRHTKGEIRASMLNHIEFKRGDDFLTLGTSGRPWSLKRIALNLDQIELYSPPPNPAKQSDGRFRKYVEETGLDESWELDALDPSVLTNLIQDELDVLRDDDIWSDAEFEMETERHTLTAIKNWWDDVASHLAGKGKKS